MGRHLSLAALALLTLTACKPVPINDFVSPTKVVSTAPAAVQILASTRPDQQLAVSAVVTTSTGAPVSGVTVTFSVTAGTITPATATTNAEGIASAVASQQFQNTISAGAAGLSQTFVIKGPVVETSPLTVSIHGDSSVYEGDSVSLGANVVSAPGATVRVVRWNFGDGTSTTANLFTTSHRYGAGDYTISVDVSDSLGRSASDSQRIHVMTAPVPEAPVLTLPPSLTSVSPASGMAGTTVPVTITGARFSAGATVAVSGANVTVSNVAVGNAGTITADLAIGPAAAAGARSVTVTSGGMVSNAQTFTVTPQTVVANISCVAVTALRQSCTATPKFNGVAIAGGLISSMTMDWGDGTSEPVTTGTPVSHNYAVGTTGNKVIRVTGSLTTGETFDNQITIGVG